MMCLQRQKSVGNLEAGGCDCLLWVLGTELQSSARVASAFKPLGHLSRP